MSYRNMTEVELTQEEAKLLDRLTAVYGWRRGKRIDATAYVGLDGEVWHWYWCMSCGRRKVRPENGEDTCAECLHHG